MLIKLSFQKTLCTNTTGFSFLEPEDLRQLGRNFGRKALGPLHDNVPGR